MTKDILLLGDDRLYQPSSPVTGADRELLSRWREDLRDTLLDHRRRHGAGRAIAAPQTGLFKRLIYMNSPMEELFINPSLEFPDEERFRLYDDCMSFPGLKVLVERHKRVVLRWQDMDFQPRELLVEGDMAELIQHEYDHLDGILATMRAVDSRAFTMLPTGGVTKSL